MLKQVNSYKESDDSVRTNSENMRIRAMWICCQKLWTVKW